jgi:hypothetical protein
MKTISSSQKNTMQQDLHSHSDGPTENSVLAVSKAIIQLINKSTVQYIIQWNSSSVSSLDQ